MARLGCFKSMSIAALLSPSCVLDAANARRMPMAKPGPGPMNELLIPPFGCHGAVLDGVRWEAPVGATGVRRARSRSTGMASDTATTSKVKTVIRVTSGNFLEMFDFFL